MAEVVRTAGFRKAAETIKTVYAQYGYKPEHSRLRLQVGAVIAFHFFHFLILNHPEGKFIKVVVE